jgi:hypothetical protein
VQSSVTLLQGAMRIRDVIHVFRNFPQLHHKNSETVSSNTLQVLQSTRTVLHKVLSHSITRFYALGRREREGERKKKEKKKKKIDQAMKSRVVQTMQTKDTQVMMSTHKNALKKTSFFWKSLVYKTLHVSVQTAF